MAENPVEFFKSCGVDAKRAEETAKNATLTRIFTSVLKYANTYPGVNFKDIVNVLYNVAATYPHEAEAHLPTLVKYVVEKKVHKNNYAIALNYLKKVANGPFNPSDFEKECGIGIVVSKEDISKAVTAALASVKKELLEERYHYPLNTLLANLRAALKWGDPKEIKDEVDAQVKALLGERTAEDNKPKKKETKPPKEVNAPSKAKEPEVEVPKELNIEFPDPKDNIQLNAKLLEDHLKATKGVVVCRFPPEPNGYLHIGHAKSMNLNFTYPKKSGGYTYLRFDDTNPEAEKLEYIESIIEDVKWMGHTPKDVTYSSDYFEQLYLWAIQLIKEDKAYVCHQTPDEIQESREKKIESPWRNRPIEESLRLFEDMRKGKFEEGKATLRLKMDMQSNNTVMRDLIAYRIKYSPHPHIGDKWCIYPSYDYTHCLIDSLENITHSLCTLEFLPRRESYYWLLDALRIYKPVVWEYSRLNLTNTVISKRKLIALVKRGHVRGWDDPRLPTIRGLRRRGYTADALNDFCDRIGITKNENLISIKLLEQCIREDLDAKTSRRMVVMKPLKVTIVNWTGEPVRKVKISNHPKDESKGAYEVSFSKVIYIEKTDFRLEDTKGYKRLAPGKEVGLLHAGVIITCKEHIIKDNEVVELKVEADFAPKHTPKGWIHWVAEPSPGKKPLTLELRLYDILFKSPEPGKLDDWESDLNPKSLEVVSGCYADLCLKDIPVGTRYQFERIGYFCSDKDSTPELPVWNRVVNLKETKWETTANNIEE